MVGDVPGQNLALRRGGVEGLDSILVLSLKVAAPMVVVLLVGGDHHPQVHLALPSPGMTASQRTGLVDTAVGPDRLGPSPPTGPVE